MRVIAIIPARGGSKGIPRKNLVRLAGKPLLAYTVEAARASGIFDRVVVSTDDKEIGRFARRYGAEVVRRPGRLARATTPTEPAMLHVLRELDRKDRYLPDVVFLLQVTAPLRTAHDIRAAFREFTRAGVDSLLSVARSAHFLWRARGRRCLPINYDFRNRPRRQDVRTQYRENGAIYITRYDLLRRTGNRLGGRIGYYVMPDERSVDIDGPADLLAVESIIRATTSKRRLPR